MKDNLNIEELFQDKFSSFEGSVSPDAWANIQQGMNAAGVAGTTAATGNELFRYSGNGAPELAAEVAAGPESSDIVGLTKWHNELYFRADTGSGAGKLTALYKFDGNAISLVDSSFDDYGGLMGFGNNLQG